MFDSTHEENIKKTRETITPIVDTKTLCVSNCSQGQHRKSTTSRKSILTDSGNLLELRQHRVEGGDRNIENQL